MAWNLGIPSEQRISHNKNSIAQQLIQEHAFIKKIMRSIIVLIAEISSHHTIDFKAIELLKKFFQVYVEKFHHQKEELLYVLFSKKTDPSSYLINDLIHEHQFEKELLSKLDVLSMQTTHIDDKKLNDIINLLKNIHHFYLTHVEKEEEYILPVIQHLDETTQKNVLNQFRKIAVEFDTLDFSYLLNLAEKELEKINDKST